MFIVLEGIDGSGKTTQARLLADKLRKNGFDVVLTSEPTDGPMGKKIKKLKARLSPQEETELFTEDRKHHVSNVIIPAVNAGRIVVSDRYYYSSAAYQGALGLDPISIVETNLAFAPKPDVTFFLELSIETALERIIHNRNACLSPYETMENLKKVKEIYFIVMDSSFVNVDAENDIQTVHCRIWSHVIGLMRRLACQP